MFVKPLAAKSQRVMEQSKNIRASSLGFMGDRSEDLDEEVKLENVTNASTAGGAHSRKQSQGEKSLTAATEQASEAVSEPSEESSDDEEYKEGTAQQFITPIEVRDHIQKLWNKEHELLGLLFGKYDPSKPD